MSDNRIDQMLIVYANNAIERRPGLTFPLPRRLRPLTRTERAVYNVLYAAGGQYCTADQIAWAMGYPCADRGIISSIRVHISHLRQKLGQGAIITAERSSTTEPYRYALGLNLDADLMRFARIDHLTITPIEEASPQ